MCSKISVLFRFGAKVTRNNLFERAIVADLKHDGSSFQAVAYDKIREDIIFCKLAPGQKLSARFLEETLGLGRTPVREALVRLGQEGLVFTVPQSGTYVSKVNLQTAENARYVREHLERSVAVECCARMDRAGRDILEGLLSEQTLAMHERDSRSFFILDNAFHKALFDIAGRTEIWQWIDSCNADLQRFRWLRTQVENLDWSSIMNQHSALYRAIASGDTDEVGYLTLAHLHLMSAEQDSVLAAFPEYFA